MAGAPDAMTEQFAPEPGEPRAEKVEPTPSDLDEAIRRRWSPRAFLDRRVSEDDLRLILEAARWAPSSYNEQPWRFIVARRHDVEAHRRMLDCLSPANRDWASGAPVLMLTVASLRFEQDGRENRHAYHDVGLAMGNLVHEAMARDLYVHQMAGIDPDKVRATYGVPHDHDVVAGVAIGFLGDPDTLDDPDRREAETRRRTRRPLEQTVFEGQWGEPAKFLGHPA